MKGALVVLLVISSSCGFLVPPKNDLEKKIAVHRLANALKHGLIQEYMLSRKTGNQSIILQNTLKTIKFPLKFNAKEIDELPEEDEFCGLCRSIFDFLLAVRRGGEASDQELKELVLGVCISLEIQRPEVCTGMINIFLDSILFIIDSNPDITSNFVCGLIFQYNDCVVDDEKLEWSIKIDENGPPITASKVTPHPKDNNLKVVHITDTHFDPEYRMGANAVCGAPACCRIRQGFPENPEEQAGKWGDYRSCDTPWEAVEDVFLQINNTQQNIDYIYVTGDYTDHGIWETSFINNANTIQKTFTSLKRIFRDVPIYPTIGNHEPHPVNMFSPKHIEDNELGSVQLYKLMSKTWDWLPYSTRHTLEYGGYYTVQVRPGLRIIVLNTNVCNTENFWLLYDPSYISEQLQWFHDTLLTAEANGEKVHLLAHYPTGQGNCYRIWAREYRRVVDRFWNTISAQFNGHTHRDEFHLFYDRKNHNHAINVAWNGGSATAFSNVNPNYRVYAIETDTFQVIDHETWIYNLTEANLHSDRNPQWFKEYSFQQAYGVPDLSPASLDKLVTNFATNPDLFDLFYQHYVKMGDPSLRRGCNPECYARTVCGIVTTEYGGDKTRCNQLLALIEGSSGKYKFTSN